MKRTWTIIGVSDVPGSLRWYQALFGQPASFGDQIPGEQILSPAWPIKVVEP
jgi:hypothetical protein